MKENFNPRSLVEIMNEALSPIRDYYDSEYVYYIEKDDDGILTIYEWCADDLPWQKEKIKLLAPEQYPRWLKSEITDTTQPDYSVFRETGGGVTAVLAVTGVHRGGRDTSFLRGIIPLITQAVALQKMQKEQEYLSYHDDLTGLLNRNSLIAYLGGARHKPLKSLGALSADINGLKNFNKEFGRDYGDEVVSRVAEVLEEYFRGAYVFRVTGDEYLVMAEDVPYEEFMKKVHAAQVKLNNISLGLVTFGYAWQKLDIDVDSVVTSAEEMMRTEKQKYYKNLKKRHHEPIIREDLLDDIKKGRFIVCLVPVADVTTGNIVGAETAVRYRHKDLGIVDPGRYINLLEETKLSHHLDLYVFEEVCRTLRRWEDEGFPMIPISVNLASATLRQADFADEMLALVKKYHVSCEYLEVEIMESYAQMNQEMLSATANKIRRENIRVILDHFGARESRFSILLLMEFDALKLDKSITANIVGNRRARIAAQAVLDVCRRLGAHVIAEGTDTQDRLNVLREIGCDYAQGDLFNKPVTIDTFELRYFKEQGAL